jgi:hypothetical protein
MVLLAVAGLLLAGLMLAPPVLLRLVDPSELDPGAVLLVIRNPLRNRGPERAAEALFGELRAGRCAHAVLSATPIASPTSPPAIDARRPRLSRWTRTLSRWTKRLSRWTASTLAVD